MSSNHEIKANNIKKSNNDVATLDSSGKQPISEVALKPTVSIINTDAASWTEPYAVNSLRTDNTFTDTFEVPYNATYYAQTNNISAFSWVKINSTSSPHGNIFSHGNSLTSQFKWAIQEQGGVLRAILSPNGTSVDKDYRSVASLDDEEWHHVGFTFTTDTLKLYVDGVHLTGGALNTVTDNTVSALHASTADLGLNCNVANGSERPLDGWGHGFTYWNKQLSDAEVTELYNSGKSYNAKNHSASANLISFWPGNRDTISSGFVLDTVNFQNALVFGNPTISTQAPPSDGTLSFTEPLQVLVPGQEYSSNNIPITESPIVFPDIDSVAYVTINTSGIGGDLTVSVDTSDNVPDTDIVVAQRDGANLNLGNRFYQTKNKFQTKTLSSNQTSDGSVSSLQFNNLKPNKFYKATGIMIVALSSGAPDTSLQITFGDGNSTEGFYSLTITDTGGQNTLSIPVSFIFKPNGNEGLFVSLSSASANSFLFGTGARDGSFLQVEELTDIEETTNFT